MSDERRASERVQSLRGDRSGEVRSRFALPTTGPDPARIFRRQVHLQGLRLRRRSRLPVPPHRAEDPLPPLPTPQHCSGKFPISPFSSSDHLLDGYVPDKQFGNRLILGDRMV